MESLFNCDLNISESDSEDNINDFDLVQSPQRQRDIRKTVERLSGRQWWWGLRWIWQFRCLFYANSLTGKSNKTLVINSIHEIRELWLLILLEQVRNSRKTQWNSQVNNHLHIFFLRIPRIPYRVFQADFAEKRARILFCSRTRGTLFPGQYCMHNVVMGRNQCALKKEN